MAIDPQVLVQLEAAVERCGVPLSDVEISYEDYLQSAEIRVSRRGALNDEQILCLRKVGISRPFPIITFEDEIVARRDRELQRIQAQKESRAWFKERGKLADLPLYDPARDRPLEFAKRLERFCGIRPGTVFEQHDTLGTVTVKSDWISQPLRRGWLWRKTFGKRQDRQFECLLHAMSATNAEEHGVKFGFVGNEYYVDEERE